MSQYKIDWSRDFWDFWTFFFNRSTRSFRLFHSTYLYFENFLYSTAHRCNFEICFYYLVVLNLESSKYIKSDQSFDFESFLIRFLRLRLLFVLKRNHDVMYRIYFVNWICIVFFSSIIFSNRINYVSLIFNMLWNHENKRQIFQFKWNFFRDDIYFSNLLSNDLMLVISFLRIRLKRISNSKCS